MDFADEHTERSKKIKVRTSLAECLSVAGAIVIVSAISGFVFLNLPIQLVDPGWDLRFISAILAGTTQLLLGCMLIFIGFSFAPNVPSLIKRCAQAGTLSSWLSIILVLLIPLQLFAGYRGVKLQSQKLYDIANNLKQVSKGIKSVSSEQQLRAFVASLPNAPQLPARFDAPLEVVKDRAITNIQGKINLAINDAERQKSENMQQFFLDSLRNTIQALLMAFAFKKASSFSKRSNYVRQDYP